MSGRKIFLFLLSVYALLAGISLFFPADGIAVAGTTLSFPGIAEVKESLFSKKDTTYVPSPEELLQQRHEAVQKAERRRFEVFAKEDPSRFYFPSDKPELLDSFFAALDSVRSKPMRILHYGDSQIEEDRITGTLRSGLQERFGGSGPGLLPFGNPYYTRGYGMTSTASLQKFMVFSDGERRNDRSYGVLGQCVRIDTSVFTTVSADKKSESPTRFFKRMTLLAGKLDGPLNLKCEGKSYKMEKSADASGLGRIVVELPDSSTRVRFSTWGSGLIYGIQLDSGDGVQVDNIPMRSCSGTIFTRLSAKQLQDFNEHENVRMLILQFGGNAMPYRKSAKSISEYKAEIEKQISYLHELLPDAAIIFIGPSDMSTNVKGKMQTYPHLPMMVDSLKAAAVNSGAIYWDLYGAMGGENSMVEWVKARPQLAGEDYVHFTPKGASAVGQMLLETMMLYYDWYRFRKK